MATTIQNLSQRQIMLSFAYLAYCGEEIVTANPEAEILGLINNAIPQIQPIASPAWQVVWGPAVYTTPGALYQDNLMFVAQNQASTSEFVIAIRGTNFVADLDWLMDDFDVLQMMPWPPGSGATTVKMSESTSVGLQILFAMSGATYTGSTPGPAISLMSFLLTQSESAIDLCVTGHSLGACLAGTLALYLKQNVPQWDRSGRSNVSCVTFAGPTAGNAAFASASDATFSGEPYPPNWDSTLGTCCDAVRCDLDVAPMAWISSNLSETSSYSPLFSIYGSNLDFATGMSFLWRTAWNDGILPDILPDVAAMLSNQDYVQIVATATALQGTFNTTYSPASDSLMSYIEAFLAQAAYQHSFSYPIILQVTELNDKNVIVRGPTPSTTTGIRVVPRLARPLMFKDGFLLVR